MSIKLICIDMDGTLLSDKHNVSQKNRKAIHYALDKGVNVAITTGRVYDCAKMYSEDIGLKTAIIASNGAYIGDLKGQIISSNPLENDSIIEFYNVVKKYNLLAYLTTKFGVVTDMELPETQVYVSLNKTLPKEKQIRIDKVEDIYSSLENYSEQILKAICIGKEPQDKNLLLARKELEAMGNDIEIVESWNDNFEVTKKGSSKGIAVEKLTQYMNYSFKEVMCIGDSENDLSMIKYAGIGVAMGNAIDIVKKSANYITDTNLNDGVAKAIYRFV